MGMLKIVLIKVKNHCPSTWQLPRDRGLVPGLMSSLELSSNADVAFSDTQNVLASLIVDPNNKQHDTTCVFTIPQNLPLIMASTGNSD